MRALICSGFESHLHEAWQYGFFRSFGFLWRLSAAGDLVPIFYDNRLSRVWADDAGIAYLKCDDDYFSYDGVNVVPVSGDCFGSVDIDQQVFGNYLYAWDGSDYPRINHSFKNIETGSVFEYKERSLEFLGCGDDCFYFFNRAKKTIIRLDSGRQIFDVYVVLADSVKIERVGRTVFIFQKKPGQVGVIEAYDLDCLQVISAIPCEDEGGSGIYFISQVEDRVYFTCGDRLIIWSGSSFNAPFPGRKIIGYRAEYNGVYVSFAGETGLCFYDPDLKILKGQQPTPVPGFCFDSLKGSTGCNFAELHKPDRNMLAGLSYLVCWSDAEFLSAETWICDVEQPIFEFHKQPAENGFSLLINVNAAEDYGVVARQAIAALDQGIYEHGAFMDRSHSPDFAGEIELHFANGQALTVEQRHQLEEASQRMLTDKYTMFTGAATGKDCSLQVTFSD